VNTHRVNLYVVLSFLTPSPPDTPIVKKGGDQLVLNNPCGCGFAYGGLQFVPAPADDAADAVPVPAQRSQVGDGPPRLGSTVSNAITSAEFVTSCWGKIKRAFGKEGEWVGMSLSQL